MIGVFVNNDPIDHSKPYRETKALKYFEYAIWTCYIQKLDGYQEALTQEFMGNFKKHNENISITRVRVVEIKSDEDVLIMVTIFPKGMKWNKDDWALAQKERKKQFCRFIEKYEEEKGSVKRETLLEPQG